MSTELVNAMPAAMYLKQTNSIPVTKYFTSNFTPGRKSNL
jgi:hypothetical protein